MKEEGKRRKEHRDSTNTKLDSLTGTAPIGHPSCTGNKTNNFLAALKLVKSSISSKKVGTTDYEKNTYEISQTNANFSKEEKVTNYINNPVEKNIKKIGNSIKMFHKSYNSSINIPYKMDIILKPILNNIIEIAELEDKSDSPIGEKTKRNKETNYTSKNKCSTNNTGHSPGKESSSNEIKPFHFYTLNDNPKKNDDLFDLDEEKEINIVTYKSRHWFNAQDNEDNRIRDGNSMINVSNLNILDTNDINYTNHNSKMLIVDSVDASNKTAIINNILMTKRRKNNFRSKQHCGMNDKSFAQSEDFRPQGMSFSGGLRISEEEFKTSFARREMKGGVASEEKRMRIRTKHFKSDVIRRANQEENKSRGPVSPIEQKINKNLLNKFNKVEKLEFSYEKNKIEVSLKEEYEYEIEMINLDSGEEKEEKEKGRVDYDYSTPVSRIRTRNCISDLNFPTKMNKTPQRKLTDSYESANYLNTVYDLDFITNLLEKENYYRCDPDYITRHEGLKWTFRAILVDWLMEICEEFAFKRDTFHYAVNYIDRFLSRSENISKSFLQLLGIAALSIAAKIEEVQIPKSKEYLSSTDDCYSEEEFIATERHILKTLHWQTIPITLNTWLSWYVCQWDLYIDTVEGLLREKINFEIAVGFEMVFFKKPDDKAYTNYRQIAQLIDLVTLDFHSMRYGPRALIAGAIFVVITMQSSNCLHLELQGKDINHIKSYLDHSSSTIVEVFVDFLKQSFNFSTKDKDFLAALMYMLTFVNFEFNYNLPLILEANEIEGNNTNYEDFISYQTHNEHNFNFIQKCLNE